LKSGGLNLIVGAKGMLGHDFIGLLDELRVEYLAIDIDDLDIRDPDQVLKTVKGIKPSRIFNLAALTDVDGCESQAELAFQVNATGAENLARAALAYEAALYHISTDYVFDGSKTEPYVESDDINPLGVYGKSKAAGETHVSRILPEGSYCIVRTQWLYGVHGKNFVETILRLAAGQKVLRVVNDQIGSPTYTVDLAAALVKLSDANARGVIHVTNSGTASWYDFARAILEYSGVRDVRIDPMSSTELDRPAPRPLRATLDNTRYVRIVSEPMRCWKDALKDYLNHRPK
jgi:dTDP-4-dehydrorhamnose reductase